MHQALLIQEILLNIFGHYCPTEKWNEHNKNLAVLARTCQPFKEPALDLLWVELYNLSPLARCLPDACCASDDKCYSFNRQLDESEWDTLRGYTRRVRHICSFRSPNFLDPSATQVLFTLAPFTDPLFPNLRSLYWRDFTILPTMHVTVPSLTSIFLDFESSVEGTSPLIEFLDIVGERCRNMKDLRLHWSATGPFDAAISRQVCRWSNLQSLTCSRITLSADAVLHLVSVATLRCLSFTLSADVSHHVSHFGSILVFPNLCSLDIESAFLKSVTQLFSYIRLPGITCLDVISNDAWKQDVQAFWAAVERACPSSTLSYLTLFCGNDEIEDLANLEEWVDLQLTLDDLPFYKFFQDLQGICIDLPWSVKLTDSDLLSLVYRSPDLIDLSINADWGWRLDEDSRGITLDGLVQLLRHCPSLEGLKLAIDTQTFTDVPQGLDVRFQPEMDVNFLDSQITPELVPGLVSVFIALKLSPFSFDGRVRGAQDFEQVRLVRSLWNCVWEAMWKLLWQPASIP